MELVSPVVVVVFDVAGSATGPVQQPATAAPVTAENTAARVTGPTKRGRAAGGGTSAPQNGQLRSRTWRAQAGHGVRVLIGSLPPSGSL